MRPRTTASAFCSPASRSPNRFSSASRTASLTSRVSAGSGVSLSNGRIATVLTLGSPPPEKWYRQAATPSVAALTAAAPQSRRNDHRRIHCHHGELKTRRALREIDAGAGGPRFRIVDRSAARHHFPALPPLGLQHPGGGRRRHVGQGVLAADETPQLAGGVLRPCHCRGASRSPDRGKRVQ